MGFAEVPEREGAVVGRAERAGRSARGSGAGVSRGAEMESVCGVAEGKAARHGRGRPVAGRPAAMEPGSVNSGPAGHAAVEERSGARNTRERARRDEGEGFEKVLDAVTGLAEAWNERTSRWLRENQVTFAQFRAILLLSGSPSQTLSQLSEGLSRARCTVTGLVDRLEAKGLVRRRRSRRDRRQVYVSLTEKGKEMARELREKVIPEIDRLGERLMERLTDAEIAVLVKALGKLSEGLGDILP